MRDKFMTIWSQLAARTDILFKMPTFSSKAVVLEIDGKYEVILPLGLPVRVKRGNLYQKRFPTREQAEKVKAAWDKENLSRRWIEIREDQ